MTAPSRTAGFPRFLVERLRCPIDAAVVTIHEEHASTPESLIDASLRCEACGRVYPVIQGIVRLLSEASMDQSALYEMQWRDSRVSEEHNAWLENKLSSLLEVPQHIRALKLDRQSSIVELACGRGRFTVRFAQICQSVLAVDFSLKSLEFLLRRLPPGSPVGLVQADINSLHFAPRSFNRAFSTSTLDSREQRLRMHHLVAEALQENGIYVYSAEHFDWRNRLLGNPRFACYPGSENTFQRMTRGDLLRETAPYFQLARVRPVQLFLPFLSSSSYARLSARGTFGRWLGRFSIRLSQFLERVPLIRNFSNLLLVVATRPVHAPELNRRSEGSAWFRYIYQRANLPDSVP